MVTRKKKRLYMLLFGLMGLGAAVALMLTAFEDNIVFFYSPSDIEQKGVAQGQYIRLGGLVADGSIERGQGELFVRFIVTDGATEIPVAYRGDLPDLFREGQGVVAQGRVIADGSFEADEVLARHDENYMPPEVSDALKRAGQWQEGDSYNGHGPGNTPTVTDM